MLFEVTRVIFLSTVQRRFCHHVVHEIFKTLYMYHDFKNILAIIRRINNTKDTNGSIG